MALLKLFIGFISFRSIVNGYLRDIWLNDNILVVSAYAIFKQELI
jgi:hypothetical protein